MIKKKISTILIIVGIAIMCIPLVGRLYTEYRQDKAYDEYLEQMEQEMSAMSETFAEDVLPTEGALALEEEVATETETAPGPTIKKPSSIQGIIGRIKIPAISSDLLLLEGASNTQLNWGAGHITGTAMPGTAGNCAIAAHRNYTFGSYFSRLGEVGIGNEIFVTYKGTTYKYRVNEIFTITPDEVWVLGTDGSAIVTLITCHPKGSNSQRLIVRGVLVTENSGQEEIPATAPGIEPTAESQPASSSELDNVEEIELEKQTETEAGDTASESTL